MITSYRRWSNQPLPRGRWRLLLLVLVIAGAVALLQYTPWALFPARKSAALDGVFVGMLAVVVVRRIHEARLARQGTGRAG